MKDIIQPPGASRPTGAWSQGVRVENLLFVAGQVGEDEHGVIVDPNDVELQTELAFSNILRVVEAAGGDADNIVKITAFLTDRADFPRYDQVRRTFFRTGFPASTTVIAEALVHPDYLVEIEAIAVLDRAD